MKESAKLIGAGLASSGLTGAGVGIGLVFASFIQGTSRFALCEAIGLFSIMLSFLILYS
ncbi:hypothetical protein MP638_002871 (mitochondrion) [Amoeboaphelidium occidentale]|nr:hypothetical protein MP638_002871 [Amoeboaphelidium occidentale]